VPHRQALDRLTRFCRSRPIIRLNDTALNIIANGTLSLYAALDTRRGEVIGQTSARHTCAEFIAFLEISPPGRSGAE